MSTDVRVFPAASESQATLSPPLPDDVALCHALIVELLDALRKSQHDCDGLRQRLDQLLRRLYGPKAERVDPNQPWLLPELAAAGEALPAPPIAATGSDAATGAKPKRAGHG